MSITQNKVVTIDYMLKGDDGSVIDSSEGGDFTYLHGAGNIIRGLENALEGKDAGEEVSVSLSPESAYGQRDDGLVDVLPRDRFDAEKVDVGMRFHAQTSSGDPIVVTVVDVQDENVTVDGNHPLAGMNLNFDVKVVDVRDATDDEKTHGHVHGAGGVQHD